MSTMRERNERALGGMSGYPAGGERDPRAPYNQREPDDCQKCDGTGRVSLNSADVEETDECPDCLGTGEEHVPTREEIAMEKADRDHDAARDREAEERQ